MSGSSWILFLLIGFYLMVMVLYWLSRCVVVMELGSCVLLCWLLMLWMRVGSKFCRLVLMIFLVSCLRKMNCLRFWKDIFFLFWFVICCICCGWFVCWLILWIKLMLMIWLGWVVKCVFGFCRWYFCWIWKKF